MIIQHLSPDYKSLMDELLARVTRLPIHIVEDGMKVRPDTIYLIPPKHNMLNILRIIEKPGFFDKNVS